MTTIIENTDQPWDELVACQVENLSNPEPVEIAEVPRAPARKVPVFLVDLWAYLRQPANAFTLLTISAWFVLFGVLWSNIIYVDDKGMHTASVNIWGDWIVHMTYTNIFHDWPMQQWLAKSPLFSPGNFRYPAAANLFSAFLMSFGLTAVQAMVTSSMIMCFALTLALFFFFRQFGMSRVWSCIGLSFFLFNGGFGFLFYFFQGAQSATHLPNEGLVIQNFIISEFVPQRAILFAAPFFVMGTALLKKALDSSEIKLQIKLMVTIGLLSNVILLSSAHTYLAFVFTCFIAGLFTVKKWKVWLVLVLVAGITNALLYFGYYGINETSAFFKWAPGELVKFSKLSIVDHFVKNYAFILPIAAYAIYRLKLWKQPFILAGLLLLCLAYLIQFQPWIWDNTKIITWAYLLLLIPALIYLNQWWRQNPAKKAVVVAVVFLSMTSGAIDVWQLVKPNRHVWQMFTAEDLRLAEEFKARTSREDIVLTHMGHNNWVHTLASRQVFKAFSGWLWTYGINSWELDNQSNKMLNGDMELLRRNSIDYIVIDRHHEPSKVRYAWSQKLDTFLDSPRYKIYKINEN